MNPIKKVLFLYAISIVTGLVFVGLAAQHEAIATTPFAGANSTEARVIQFRIWEDGSGSILYSNGTKLQFLHKFMDPHYLYENNTIIFHNANNGNEVLKD